MVLTGLVYSQRHARSCSARQSTQSSLVRFYSSRRTLISGSVWHSFSDRFVILSRPSQPRVSSFVTAYLSVAYLISVWCNGSYITAVSPLLPTPKDHSLHQRPAQCLPLNPLAMELFVTPGHLLKSESTMATSTMLTYPTSTKTLSHTSSRPHLPPMRLTTTTWISTWISTLVLRTPNTRRPL